MVQWLRLYSPNAGGPGLIPGQVTRSHMLQLKVRMPQLKEPYTATKTGDHVCHSWHLEQLNKKIITIKKDKHHLQSTASNSPPIKYILKKKKKESKFRRVGRSRKEQSSKMSWGTKSLLGFAGGSVSKESASNTGDHLQHRSPGFDPWVRKMSGEGNGNPLRYSCLGNSMDRGAWRATVHEVARVRYDLATKSSKHLDLGRRGLQGAGVIEHWH